MKNARDDSSDDASKAEKKIASALYAQWATLSLPMGSSAKHLSKQRPNIRLHLMVFCWYCWCRVCNVLCRYPSGKYIIYAKNDTPTNSMNTKYSKPSPDSWKYNFCLHHTMFKSHGRYVYGVRCHCNSSEWMEKKQRRTDLRKALNKNESIENRHYKNRRLISFQVVLFVVSAFNTISAASETIIHGMEA